MPDRIFFPLVALAAAGLIALAMVWPQGQGAVSPPPFGHPLAPMPPPPVRAAPAAPANPAKPQRKPPAGP